MSRRQALGVISNNHPIGNNINTKALVKNSISNTSIKSSNCLSQENNENEAPKKNSSSELECDKQAANFEDFEFEIFQEELCDEFVTVRDVRFKEDLKKALDKENLAKKETHVVFNNDYDDEEDEEDDEDEDYHEDEDEEDEEEADEQEDLEEEGISRLNLAQFNEESKNDLISTSVLMSMDSSSVNHDLSSPMILDDTIAYQSGYECNESLDEGTRSKTERDNLLMNCLEYKDDILKYMRHLETQNRPKSSYMKKQQDITSSMRSILIDWLVEVTEEYKLNVETLYLAVNYTDRFLSQMSVLRGKLQLVGTASMYIASKYEEISPPDVSEFVFITDDTYTKKQVLRMEHLLLKVGFFFNLFNMKIKFHCSFN